jgi:hypothetical protein
LVFYAIHQGYFGPVISSGREPDRVASQFMPERVKLLATEANATTKATSGTSLACSEFGGFNTEDVRKVEPLLEPLAGDVRMSIRHADEQASFIVFLPPFKTRADADHAVTELKRIGVEDLFVIQDPGPFKLGISLGIFKTEEAAKTQLTSLAQLGVKNAKTGQRPTSVAKTYYQFRNPDPSLLAKLGDIKQQFPNADLHECGSSVPPAAVAASGAASTAASGAASVATSDKGR